jgi:vacuolar-type H+-ATPase subunit H/uncharacterized membrane protein
VTSAPDSPVADYIHRLDRELRVRRAPRRRLLAEAEDHLRSSADELVREGRSAAEAEREAVARFGAAADVARGFAHAAASSTARAAVAWAAAVFLAYGATATLFLVAAPSWLRDFPHGAPSMFALQVAAVALGVTAVRVLQWRRTLVLDEERLRLVANGALTASVAVALGAGAELFVALTRPAAAPWAEAAPLIGTFALAAILCVPASLVAGKSYARASGVGGRGDAGLSLADDLEAVAPMLGRLVRTALERPGLTCAAVAGSAFVAVAVAQLVGTDSSSEASLLLGAIAVGLIEAAAVVIGFLTLGRPLGLRARRHASS